MKEQVIVKLDMGEKRDVLVVCEDSIQVNAVLQAALSRNLFPEIKPETGILATDWLRSL